MDCFSSCILGQSSAYSAQSQILQGNVPTSVFGDNGYRNKMVAVSSVTLKVIIDPLEASNCDRSFVASRESYWVYLATFQASGEGTLVKTILAHPQITI